MRRTKLPQTEITPTKQKKKPRRSSPQSKKQSEVSKPQPGSKEWKELVKAHKGSNNKFLPGNQLWRYMTNNKGKPPKYTPEKLLEKAMEYFEWVMDNPFYETRAFVVCGTIEQEDIPKMRPFTLDGFQIFADISDDTYRNYRNKQEYVGVTAKIDKIIRTQKFEGASSGFFNTNIIARDLGLADKKDLTSSDGTMSPVNSDEKAKQNRELLMAQLGEDK